MPRPHLDPTITTHRVASPSGVLPARVICPNRLSGLPPLVVLHGISRNAEELVDLFTAPAQDAGRLIVVPYFSEKRWPFFQRPSRAARPDQALLAMMAHLATISPLFAGRFDLFGHSGGAQLAHRFAMLYPHRVGRLHLAAAGWYCLPDTSMSYPYGLANDDTAGAVTWARRHKQALPHYLTLPVNVYVGTQDTDRDDSLRQALDLDHVQGLTRIDRAETYVDRFRAAARARGIVPDITLNMLPGVTHDVARAIGQGGLAQRVTGPVRPAALSLAM